MEVNCWYHRWDREPLTERHVQALWYDAAMRPVRLYTREGAELRVVDPGEWNLGAGPDFLGAVVEVGPEGRRLKGDVEVHLRPSDWSVHGHGGDCRYSNVIVHVTWSSGPEPDTLPRGAISVCLGRHYLSDASFTPEAIDLGAYPFARLPSTIRPCQQKIGSNPELALVVMSAAGEHRLRRKAVRISEALATIDRRQLFYEEMMTALGYRRNSRQFRSIARRVRLETWPNDREGLVNALVVAAGFEDFDRFALRPRNEPTVRLRAAASVFLDNGALSLIEAKDFSEKGLRAMVSLLTRDSAMGRGRAGAVIANVVVPFAIAESRLEEIPEWLPPEDISEPVRLTAFRLLGRDHNPSAFYANNDIRIQGLIQIHRDFCLNVHPDCEGCGMVKEVA